MHLILIRHGETDWNNERRIQGHTDTPLNLCGIEQAHKLAFRLVEEKLDTLYASPLSRARMTAEIIGQKCGLVPILDERLKEKGLGDFEGLTAEELQERHPELYHGWVNSKEHFPLPNEEPLIALHERIQAFLADLHAAHPNGSQIGIVSHGGTVGTLVGMLIGLELNRRSPFWFDNASVTQVDLSGSRPRIRLLNDTCHLHDK
ncbi:MAG: histidine phosphatase family protein [Chloroflexi bacterium]|nr:histidine phosphatase family protein [Chloroflexota bacterium]